MTDVFLLHRHKLLSLSCLKNIEEVWVNVRSVGRDCKDTYQDIGNMRCCRSFKGPGKILENTFMKRVGTLKLYILS